MQETQETKVLFLGQEDPIGGRNGNPLQYSCLGNPWTEKPGELQSIKLQKTQMGLSN